MNKDLKTAIELYDKACTDGSMSGCNNAGLVWQSGFRGQPANFEQAARYFKKSCAGGLKNGCFNLSGMYLQGKGTILKDMQKALEYSVRSCELGHPWGCSNASRIYRLGDGVTKDEEKAKDYKSRAKKLRKEYVVTTVQSDKQES